LYRLTTHGSAQANPHRYRRESFSRLVERLHDYRRTKHVAFISLLLLTLSLLKIEEVHLQRESDRSSGKHSLQHDFEVKTEDAEIDGLEDKRHLTCPQARKPARAEQEAGG